MVNRGSRAMGDGSRSRRGRPIRLSSRGCGELKKCSLRAAISSALSEEIAAQLKLAEAGVYVRR